MKSLVKTTIVGLFTLIASALPLLAQDDQQAPANSAGSAIGGAIGGLVGLAIGVVVLIGMWKVFTKAGQPGWACLIPFYNFYVLLKVVGRPGWWLVMMLIPFVSLVFAIIVMIDLAKSFGKGGGFAAGLILLGPIFICLLGYGDARYVGPAAGGGALPVAA